MFLHIMQLPKGGYSHQQRWERIETHYYNNTYRILLVTPTNNGGSGLKPQSQMTDEEKQQGYSHQQRWERIETDSAPELEETPESYSHQQRWERIETNQMLRPAKADALLPPTTVGAD